MQLDIVHYGDPVLRQASREVGMTDAGLRRLAEDMLETMHVAKGVGLAAQQVGRLESVCVIDVPADCEDDEATAAFNSTVAMPLVMVNPRIIGLKGECRGNEGCLSFPSVGGEVTRAEEVTAQYRDLDGMPQMLTVRGFLARAVQHEVDHLNGVLYIDRMDEAMRQSKAKKLTRLLRKNGGVA